MTEQLAFEAEQQIINETMIEDNDFKSVPKPNSESNLESVADSNQINQVDDQVEDQDDDQEDDQVEDQEDNQVEDDQDHVNPGPKITEIDSDQKPVDDDTMLNDIVDKTVEAHRKSGKEITPEDIDDIKKQARDIIKNKQTSSTEGAEDMRLLVLAIGLPAAKILFDVMIENCTATKLRKKAMYRDASKMCKHTDAGCIKVEFYNKDLDKKDIAYIMLDKCSANHNLTEQIHKLFRHVDESEYKKLREHLSAVVNIGRNVYAQMLTEHANLVKRIQRNMPKTFDAHVLRVNPNNTTMYLGPDTRNSPDKWEPCVGIFIRLDSEIKAQAKKITPTDD